MSSKFFADENKKIAGALGAEIFDVDLTQTLTTDLVKEIRNVFLWHGMIYLRNQPLTSQQFMNFAKAMGEPIEYPFVKGFEEFPQIIEVKKLEHEKVNFGGVWHSDTTYLEKPPLSPFLKPNPTFLEKMNKGKSMCCI